MRSDPRRTMHLIFLAHLWACVPFLLLWIFVPSTHSLIPADNFARVTVFVGGAFGYLLVRTWLAFREPSWLRWEYVFPAIDVGIVSTLILLANRDPLSNIGLLYFFPLAETAATLNLRWSVAVAALVIASATLATHGLQSAQPFNAVFRYFLILVFASLFTMLARAAARLREDLALSVDRNRMAMEMHDGVQSHLMSLTKQLELIERVASSHPERTASLASEGRESSRLAADELRYLVTRMRSPLLAAGFLPALRNFTESFAERHGLSLGFKVDGDEAQTDVGTQHAAFRIVQEAITNVVRHAAATKVKIVVEYKPKWISISVTDNGRGFDPSTESEGLDGMRRRAREVGGNLLITSTPKVETRIEATLPLEMTHG